MLQNSRSFNFRLKIDLLFHVKGSSCQTVPVLPLEGDSELYSLCRFHCHLCYHNPLKPLPKTEKVMIQLQQKTKEARAQLIMFYYASNV